MVAAAANGRYFGGGMQVAPGARPDDGLLDVVVVPGLSKPRLLAELPRIYRGTHIGVGGVQARRGRVLEAVFIALLEGDLPRTRILAALLAYRAIYYLAPLLVAAAVYVGLELRARRTGGQG